MARPTLRPILRPFVSSFCSPFLSALAGFAILAGACSTAARTPQAPLARSALDAVLQLRSPQQSLAAMLAIEKLADACSPACAAWWTLIQQSPDADIALRTLAASKAAELGFTLGNEFCLAVLGANLLDFAESDRRFALPRSDRWAFAREIALAHLRGLLIDAEQAVPDYDVNAGAPQLAAGARAFSKALARVPSPGPMISRAQLEAVLPDTAPAGITNDAWQQAVQTCLRACPTTAGKP